MSPQWTHIVDLAITGRVKFRIKIIVAASALPLSGLKAHLQAKDNSTWDVGIDIFLDPTALTKSKRKKENVGNDGRQTVCDKSISVHSTEFA